jgi:hypothetical protein
MLRFSSVSNSEKKEAVHEKVLHKYISVQSADTSSRVLGKYLLVQGRTSRKAYKVAQGPPQILVGYQQEVVLPPSIF